MLTTLAIANYRSLRSLVISLKRLNIVSGANGSGKSSLYRALRLLAKTSQGSLVAALAREGGMPSTLWAGPQKITDAMKRGRQPVQGTVRQNSVYLRLGFSSDEFSYAIDLGMPNREKGSSAFVLDPEIKHETIWVGPRFRKSSMLVQRLGPSLRITDDNGRLQNVNMLPTFESMMTSLVDPRCAPEMIQVRERIKSWRFYDHLRTDAEAPSRQPQIGTHTPVLADDGGDLAAALQTINEIGDAQNLRATIEDAFPGSTVEIIQTEGRFDVTMRQYGLLRPLKASELSDGTLRYLLLVAALLTPRPPQLLVLNEPETSLHPDLISPLARLIITASERSQIILVTHNEVLISKLACLEDTRSIKLEKILGETQIVEEAMLDRASWEWPP